MAEESSQSQEKTEDATPKRLREARKKGQVAKSKDMNTIVILGMDGFFSSMPRSVPETAAVR